MMDNVQQKTIEPLMRAVIRPGTRVYTDEYDIYNRLTLAQVKTHSHNSRPCSFQLASSA